MKIFEVIAGFGAGGAETLLKDLAIGFKEKDHEVVVIIVDQFSDDVSEIFKIKHLREKGIKVISLGRKPKNKSIFLLFSIYKVLKKYQPTVIHLHSYLAAIYFFPFSFIFKTKYVQTLHSSQINVNKFYKIFYTLFSLKYKNVYCSDEAYSSSKKWIGEGIVINNGITFHSNNNTRKRIEEDYNIPEESFILLNVGRVVPAKNQLLLIDLIEKLNNELYKGKLYLLICGKHSDDSLYRKIINRSNQLEFRDNIKFLGVQDNINNLMYSSDLYISSSIYEGLPITVLESINTGVPIVLSPIKEHLNVFSNLEACYFPDENIVTSYVSLFKSHAHTFAIDKEEVIRKRALFIKKYNIDQTVLMYLDYFKKISVKKNV